MNGKERRKSVKEELIKKDPQNFKVQDIIKQIAEEWRNLPPEQKQVMFHSHFSLNYSIILFFLMCSILCLTLIV
jgi:hypothetical protein